MGTWLHDTGHGAANGALAGGTVQAVRGLDGDAGPLAPRDLAVRALKGAVVGAVPGAAYGAAHHLTHPHDEPKHAFLNTAMGAAKAIGSNVVKPLQNSVIGKAIGTGLGTLGKGYNALGSLKATPKTLGGSLSMSSNQPSFKPQQSMKVSASSPSETPHPVFVRAAYHLLVKRAYHPGWHRPVNALSYAAFAAPYVSQTVHDNARLSAALNAAGLVGLGATAADSVAHGDDLAAYDLAGLGVMGAGMLRGAHRAATAHP